MLLVETMDWRKVAVIVTVVTVHFRARVLLGERSQVSVSVISVSVSVIGVPNLGRCQTGLAVMELCLF